MDYPFTFPINIYWVPSILQSTILRGRDSSEWNTVLALPSLAFKIGYGVLSGWPSHKYFLFLRGICVHFVVSQTLRLSALTTYHWCGWSLSLTRKLFQETEYGSDSRWPPGKGSGVLHSWEPQFWLFVLIKFWHLKSTFIPIVHLFPFHLVYL